jgi:CxxC-x17-CxxC domain-containing protein
MSYQDKNLSCQDCGSSFVFSADDQQYHADKGFDNEPKRCPNCRASRRTSGGGGGGGGYGSRQREMHPATCAQCGKETEVPFRPTGSRPVYCSDCFSKQPASSNRNW